MKPIRQIVRSADNTFQRVDVLRRNREKRHRYAEFLVEGELCLKQLAASNWKVRAFVFSQDRELPSWAQSILNSKEHREEICMDFALLEQLSDKETPSELLAIVEIPEDSFSRIAVSENLLVIVMDRPGSPGNLGSTIRSAVALGADAVIVTGHAADVYDPKAVRASMGALFHIPVIRIPSPKDIFDWLGKLALQFPEIMTLGADAQGAQSLSELDLARPLALFLGSETHGLSQGLKNSCASLVSIPMKGKVDSLNVSCAASILLYEVMRQRSR